MPEEISKVTPQSITDKNLITQVKTQSKFFRPNIYKPLVLNILTAFSALWFGFAYMKFLGSGNMIALLISLGIFMLLSTLQIFFTKDLTRRIFIIILQAVCMLIPFYSYGITFLGVAAGAYVIFTAWGEFLAFGELENSVELRFFSVARLFLKKLTTALVLFMIVLYLPNWNDKRAFIPEENFRSVYTWAAEVAKNFYPNIDFNSTFAALTRSMARAELQDNPAYKDLSPVDQESNINLAAEQIRARMSKSLGVEISPESKTSDVFYDSILKLLSQLKERFKNSFLILWALVAFLIIRSLGMIFYWIVMIISFILYELLLTVEFIRITGVPKTHEVIDF